ncbi:hypothetical protein BGZ83_005201 [Gryganskiella cystojenkinii]|nr:hypothetical protein BGZ83_005201 [Gryganskiella cystojenkinii]
MPRFRTKIKHLLLLLVLGYGYSVYLLQKSSKKPTRHVSSKFRVQPRDVDPSLKKLIHKLPLKERFEIERRHIGYNLKLDQKDDFDFATCGTWPGVYLKNRQLQNPRTVVGQQKQPPPESFNNNADHWNRRILIHACGGENEGSCGTLSDRLLSTASLFIYSLMTDREFFLDWQGTRSNLRSVLRTPFLNLNLPRQDPNERHDDEIQARNPLPVSFQDWDAIDLDIAFRIQSTSVYLQTTSRTPTTQQNRQDQQQQPHQQAIEIRNQISTAPKLRVQLNRGLVQRFLTDPAYSDRLERMGLRQHTAYACVLSFLFRLTPILQELIHQYRAVFKSPGVITIGIHIPSRIDKRSHPQLSRPRRLSLTDFDQSIPCAQDLSHMIQSRNIKKTELAPRSIRFLYVIFTDSETIRNQVQEQYGQELDLVFPPALHARQQLSLQSNDEDRKTRFERRGEKDAEGDREEEEEDEESMVQSYLFSETDYQIVTSTAFSKLALFRKGSAGRRTAIWMPSKEELVGDDRGAPDPVFTSSNSPKEIKLPDCSRFEDAIAPWDMLASLEFLG